MSAGWVEVILTWVSRALVDVLASVEPTGECVRWWDAAASAFVACAVHA